MADRADGATPKRSLVSRGFADSASTHSDPSVHVHRRRQPLAVDVQCFEDFYHAIHRCQAILCPQDQVQVLGAVSHMVKDFIEQLWGCPQSPVYQPKGLRSELLPKDITPQMLQEPPAV